MNAREKAASLSTCLNILLTLLKFALFGITGSLAILAEAWHSFSDVATSLLVLLSLSVRRRRGKSAPPQGSAEEPAQGGDRTSVLEVIAALVIGVLLAAVAASLFVEFFRARPAPVRNSLLSGIIFLAFALGSYLLYRFETAVGRHEGSVGLVADGMHARADMVSSLIVGFSLVLYALGIDLDRWAAGLVALFILAFAVETLVNASMAAARKRRDILLVRRTQRIQTALLDREAWITLAEILRRLEIRAFLAAAARLAPVRRVAALVMLCLLGWLASTCFFTVGVAEQAVIERFGRCRHAVDAPLGPGLHLKLPWPVDRAVKVDTGVIRAMNIGNTVDTGAFALLWTEEHGSEFSFISGDNDYFYPYLVIHYRVKDARDYLYRHADPEELLETTAYRTMTRLFTARSFHDIVLAYRNDFARDLGSRVQEEMDRLRAGLELVAVNIKDVHPPVSVAESFEQVIGALQEKEEAVNKALGNASEILLETRGEAARAQAGAAAYAREAELRAEGDAGKFLASIPEGAQARVVTRRRLHLERVRVALAGREILLLDPRAGAPELWLDAGDVLGRGVFDLEKTRY